MGMNQAARAHSVPASTLRDRLAGRGMKPVAEKTQAKRSSNKGASQTFTEGCNKF